MNKPMNHPPNCRSESELIIESPCVGVCTLDERDYCVGCFRSSAEIALWASLGPMERERIMDELPDREPGLRRKSGEPR